LAGGAKLTEPFVIEIRNAYALGNISQRDLARQHGVAHCTIGEIVRRQTWTHLP
jgi:hypothetical protein